MITQDPNYDLTKLQPYFTDDKDAVLKELLAWQKTKDLFCIVGSDDAGIFGFIIGHVFYESLFIVQSYHRKGTPLSEAKWGFDRAKEWARERGLTSITGETQRTQKRAMERFGFKEVSVNMKCNIEGA